jgi:hypothetical protein
MSLKALFFVYIVGTLACFVGATPSDQVDALVDLFDATNGPQWKNSQNWLQGDPCTNMWHGVTCDDNQNVIVL